MVVLVVVALVVVHFQVFFAGRGLRVGRVVEVVVADVVVVVGAWQTQDFEYPSGLVVRIVSPAVLQSPE